MEYYPDYNTPYFFSNIDSDIPLKHKISIFDSENKIDTAIFLPDATTMKHPLKLQAFTLIELLVVIAIIAILAGISFPVIMRTKMKGMIVKSSSNLKNIGVACRLYTSDNDGFFPVSATPATTAARSDYNLLIPNYASKGVFQAPTDTTALNIAKTNSSATLVSNENSYTYFSGLDVIALSGAVSSSTDSSIPLASERLNQKPLVNTNAQALTTTIFNGTGVNILKSDGSVAFTPATNAPTASVKLYRDITVAVGITNLNTNAGWRNNE